MEMIPSGVDEIFDVLHHFVESRVVAAFWTPQRSCLPFSYATSHSVNYQSRNISKSILTAISCDILGVSPLLKPPRLF